ncbi:hypothetical protein ACHAW5_002540 [Stephanodiscus triporus]|uniref:Uncharacterized protein n=1 Tax=Stephanodiscus triporus TaxID=2934178 RepID=A0ABD3PMH1_9STRA
MPSSSAAFCCLGPPSCDLRGEDGRGPRLLAVGEGGGGDIGVDAESSGRSRLAKAAASLIARRKMEANGPSSDGASSFPSSASIAGGRNARRRRRPNDASAAVEDGNSPSPSPSSSYDLIDLTKRIDQKILSNGWNRSGMRRRSTDKPSGMDPPVRHDDSMQSLLGYNEVRGEWSDRNSTTYHVAVVFGKPLIRDQVTIEYAARLRTLARMLGEESPSYRPRLVCFANGGGGAAVGGGSGGTDNRGNDAAAVSDASAGYVYFRHLCASQNITIDDARTEFWVDDDRGCGGDERSAMERVASELWRRHIKTWLKDRPLTQRLNQHYGVGWTVLERRVDIHFTLVSTDYHLCNLNDVHNRSPRKSFLQPLVSLRGLVGSDRWINKDEALEVMGPGYSSSVHVRNGNGGGGAPSAAEGGNNFGGIENSVDTSWSYQYGTYPFLHGEEDAVVFLGQCYLLGEELTPLLVNMRGVVERTEFFQRDNYLLLSSIRRSLVSLVEALYTDKGQEIRAGVIRYFEQSRGRNQFTKEDVKIIVVLESALLNLGRCLDLVKPAGLLVSSVPAATWSKALFNLEESMSRIKTVCDPDQPLNTADWGKLFD